MSSFAGVGYHLGLARLLPGERVLDLGSGSGMDVFAAAAQVGPGGSVTGVDITPEQLARSERLRRDGHVSFRRARIEQLPFENGSFDAVISNGVVNSRPKSAACSPRRRACCGRADGSRSPTSSPSGRSPRHRLPGRPLGRLHRRRRPPRSLPRGDRGRRPRAGAGPGQPGRPLHERTGAARKRKYGAQSVSLLALKPVRERASRGSAGSPRARHDRRTAMSAGKRRDRQGHLPGVRSGDVAAILDSCTDDVDWASDAAGDDARGGASGTGRRP